jgi:hypothetical protein
MQFFARTLNPQPNPQNAMSYTTSANFGSPRGSVKSLKSLLSRQRSRVRVSSSPPFQIKHLQKWRCSSVGTKRYQIGTSSNAANSLLLRPRTFSLIDASAASLLLY